VNELDAVAASIETLGPILELDRRWGSNPATVEEAKAIRAEIQEVLDRPWCAYDDAAFGLSRAVTPASRRLIGAKERRMLIPYAVRAPFLALEERSAKRLRSGLVVHALALPDEDDYRDVMIALAPARVVADEIGADAAAIFAEAAEFAGQGIAETFRAFGERETGLGAFGWKRVQTPHGIRFHLSWV
jgi:hypothetical protein